MVNLDLAISEPPLWPDRGPAMGILWGQNAIFLLCWQVRLILVGNPLDLQKTGACTMNDTGIIWTLVLGAVGGFAGGWFQSWLRRDEERLKLHREKMETLYSMENEWSEAASDIYVMGMTVLPSAEDWDEIGKTISKNSTNIKRIRALIRFYANRLMAKHIERRKRWLDLINAIQSDERDDEEIEKRYKAFKESSSILEDEIVNESKKFIPQSFTDRCKNMIPARWKSKSLR
jgi:hypothetical protein